LGPLMRFMHLLFLPADPAAEAFAYPVSMAAAVHFVTLVLSGCHDGTYCC
jgi:hypothetical protein